VTRGDRLDCQSSGGAAERTDNCHRHVRFLQVFQHLILYSCMNAHGGTGANRVAASAARPMSCGDRRKIGGQHGRDIPTFWKSGLCRAIQGRDCQAASALIAVAAVAGGAEHVGGLRWGNQFSAPIDVSGAVRFTRRQTNQ
jgi:hypothetical protein